jgi:GNAT superfamily N-acetyltransferase
MTIRFATKKDKSQVLKLMDEFSLLLKAKDVPSVVGGKMFDEIIKNKNAKIFIAEENELLTGMAILFLLPNIRHGYLRGHIEDFFVIEGLRGKRIGTAIFEKIKDYCQKNKISVIKLNSGNDLVDAHKFYEKNGGKTTEKFFRFEINKNKPG